MGNSNSIVEIEVEVDESNATLEDNVIQLPADSTIVDAAYYVTPETGNTLVAGKIDGRLVPLKTTLRESNRLRLITMEKGRPNPRWLMFVQTSLARSSIHQALFLAHSDDTLDAETLETVDLVIPQINRELIKFLAQNPKYLYSISPRQFEELVAEILHDMGHDVVLTPKTHDKGRDILAVLKTPTHEVLTIVDCKRYAPERPVDPRIVQRLLWVAQNQDRASQAMIATTSRFSSGAKQLAEDYSWQLVLKDFQDVSRWLRKYGSWSVNPSLSYWNTTHEYKKSKWIGERGAEVDAG